MTASSPLVSVVLATHNSAETLGQAIASVLGQTLRELELVVVDDASGDATGELLEAIDDPRLVVISNEVQLGLAASLNRGLDGARARYVARLDADDVALPGRLDRQLRELRARPELALLGSAILEIDGRDRPGALHAMPAGHAPVRWHLLFGCPFFHPSVVVDRELFDRHRLRYDVSFGESEDYELWGRLLAVAEGDNIEEPLVLKRLHPGQASLRRFDLQHSLRREVALREIVRVAPELGSDGAELAWALGAGQPLEAGRAGDALDAYLSLLDTFGGQHRGDPGLRAVRRAAARTLARAAVAREAGRGVLLRRALALDPLLAVHGLGSRRRRSQRTEAARREARRVLARPSSHGVRVVVVSPEPTPYRSPLLDLVAARPEVELTVVYAAGTVVGRTWHVEPRHDAVFLRGVRVPGVRRLLRHEYPLTPGVSKILDERRPEVVVVNGWSTYAAQAAIWWCRRRHVPYVLLVSSHDAVARSAWRRAVRRPIVPRVVRGAWGGLALGSLSRASLVANGIPPQRIGLFANTVDVAAWGDRVDRLAGRRDELRSALGLSADDVAVLCVARLAPEKGLDALLRAAAAAGDSRLVVTLAGAGPEEAALRGLAAELGVRLVLAGEVPWERMAAVYAAADVFALLSSWEPWGVVVNEAAASGLPIVLSEQVGAAADLLVDGDNGALVPVGDVDAAAAALQRFAQDPVARRAAGARSRELVQGWGYEPSVDSFVEIARIAAGAAREPAGSRPASTEVLRAQPGAPVRVTAVFPEPTPYRAPLLDLIGARPDVDLTVVHAAETVVGRTWTVTPRHREVMLAGVRVPGLRRVLRHDYVVNRGVWNALDAASPDVVVVEGWSTFAAQASVVWARRRRIPYVLLVSSHDYDARHAWRRAVKAAVVPRVVRSAAGVLVAGSRSRESILARGSHPDRMRTFAYTIDVHAFGERADRLAARRSELRGALGLDVGDVAVVSVGRLVPEKAFPVLIEAVAEASDPRLVLVLVGDGPQRAALEQLAARLGARVTFLGDVSWERVAEIYAAADIFALLSAHEPWGVVVNEAAASGLPLVLSDAVGAAPDLLRDGGNGFLVPVGDVAAAAGALTRLASDEALRQEAGRRSREVVSAWGYELSVDSFVAAVREAARPGAGDYR